MKLRYFLIFLFCITTTVNAQERNWGVGVRVGAFNQRTGFSGKTQISDPDRNIHNGFYYQAFVNRQFGKKQNWMLEANLGFNSFTYESTQFFPSMTAQNLYEYSFNRTNVYSLQLNLRYAFYTIQDLKWKHYLGISIAANRNLEQHSGIFNTHTPDPSVIGHNKTSYTIYHNFVGGEYFGKIQLNKRLSVQYLLGYNFSTQTLAPNGKDNNDNSYSVIYDGPTIHKFNFNFGLGYQL